ncbi:amidohydrolase [Butyrivibrio sp. JL13D10]|uniref:amidohydrolase n=1 Tax=Butyrivibrio sp. JL13D10 TaxID=3236815 RepID=UPI0038B67FA5
MRVDKIVKNARIFTADKRCPKATAFAVKDGKFVYVGGEDGLAAYEGEVTDYGGKFVMPDIIDSHVHISIGVGVAFTDTGVYAEGENKKEVLDFIEGYIKENPGQERYRFQLERDCLGDENIVKEELDAICADSEILIVELEAHSIWVNSKILEKHKITDDTPDIIPGHSYYVRKDGHVTGNIYEFASWRIIFDHLKVLSDEQIEAAVMHWIGDSLDYGVSCVFDAGFPEHEELHERVYECLRNLDKQGKLPVYVDGCYVLTRPENMRKAIEETKRFRREYNSEHFKVHTLKIFMDGTLKIQTAALVTPYEDTGAVGATTFEKEDIAEILKLLNEEGLDLHVHTVGERASRIILDGVELAKKELGDNFHVKVTCAHLEIQDDADLDRFAKLGVFADFTPWWHAGNIGGTPLLTWQYLLGDKRAHSMYRCKTLWDTGATVTFSSDEVYFGYNWNPFLGMEVGMTRCITENTRAYDFAITAEAFPPEKEKMDIEEMMLGYTINGAKQLGIDESKGSIEVGKDADFLVFEDDLLAAEHEGFSNNSPCEMYICGEKIK